MPLSKAKDRERKRSRFQPNSNLTPETVLLGEAPGVEISKAKAIKLLKICAALDREIQGLGQKESMLDLVRYGDMRMREVGKELGYAP